MTDDILADVDPEVREGLEAALRDHPELLREKLEEMGVIDDAGAGTHAEVELSPPEEALLPVVKRLQNPKSAAELKTIIEEEQPEEVAGYDSATHREWISTQLNKLARKGFIGKYRDGRSVRYTAEPLDAVRRWALHNNKFESELDLGDVDAIVAETGMERQAVIGAVKSVSSN